MENDFKGDLEDSIDEDNLKPKVATSWTVGGFTISRNIFLILASIGTIMGMSGQLISLPLFEASFGRDVGVYFILLFSSIMFNVAFWIGVLYKVFVQKSITKEMWRYKNHWKLIAVGVCDALNGLLTVYSASSARTPAPLQAILIQMLIPFSLVFSWVILRKRYKLLQLFGAFLVLIGIGISLVPLFIDVATGGSSTSSGSSSNTCPIYSSLLTEPTSTPQSVSPESTFQTLYWSTIFVLALVPAVGMNIIEEWIFHDMPEYDITLLLAFESLYQMLAFFLLFWTDIIPDFGTSKNIDAWWHSITWGVQCFFAPWTVDHAQHHCDFSALTGVIFTLAYCFSYVFGGILMKYASANFNAIVQAATPPVVVTFWIIFKGLNCWAGGAPITLMDIIFDYSSLVVIVAGMILYRWYEAQNKDAPIDKIMDPAQHKLIN